MPAGAWAAAAVVVVLALVAFTLALLLFRRSARKLRATTAAAAAAARASSQPDAALSPAAVAPIQSASSEGGRRGGVAAGAGHSGPSEMSSQTHTLEAKDEATRLPEDLPIRGPDASPAEINAVEYEPPPQPPWWIRLSSRPAPRSVARSTSPPGRGGADAATDASRASAVLPTGRMQLSPLLLRRSPSGGSLREPSPTGAAITRGAAAASTQSLAPALPPSHPPSGGGGVASGRSSGASLRPASAALIGSGATELRAALELEPEPASARGEVAVARGLPDSPSRPTVLLPLRLPPHQLPSTSPHRRPHGARVTPLGVSSPQSPSAASVRSASGLDDGGRASAGRRSGARSGARSELDVDSTNIRPSHGRRGGSGRGGSDDGYALNSVSPGPQAHSTETLGLQASATGLDAVDAVSSLFGAGGGVGAGIGSKPLPPLRSVVGSPPSPPLADVPTSPPGGDVASRWPVRKQMLGPLGQSGISGRGSGSGTESDAPPGPVLGATPSHSELLSLQVSSAAQLSDAPSASAPSPPTVAWAAPAQRHVPPAASPGLRQPGAPVAPRTSIVVVGPRGGGGADDGVVPSSAAPVPPLRVPLAPRSGALSSRARAPGVATARPRVAAGSGEGSSVWGSNRLPRPASLATATLIAARRAEAVARTAEAPLSARPAFRGLAWGPGIPDLSATEVDDYDDDDDDGGTEPPATQIRPATSPVGAAVLRAGAARGGFSAGGGSTAPVPSIGQSQSPVAGPASASQTGGVSGVRQAWARE